MTTNWLWSGKRRCSFTSPYFSLDECDVSVEKKFVLICSNTNSAEINLFLRPNYDVSRCTTMWRTRGRWIFFTLPRYDLPVSRPRRRLCVPRYVLRRRSTGKCYNIPNLYWYSRASDPPGPTGNASRFVSAAASARGGERGDGRRSVRPSHTVITVSGRNRPGNGTRTHTRQRADPSCSQRRGRLPK